MKRKINKTENGTEEKLKKKKKENYMKESKLQIGHPWMLAQAKKQQNYIVLDFCFYTVNDIFYFLNILCLELQRRQQRGNAGNEFGAIQQVLGKLEYPSAE